MIKKVLIKKAVVLTALIAAPAAMAAAPQPTAITIAAQKPTVIYGQSTDLTGTVSPAQSAGVSIAAKTCLNPPARVALASPLTVTSTGTGDWATSVTPPVRTFYQATAGDAQSDTAMVNVRPRVTLVKVAAHKFRTRVSAARSFAGKRALFQKRNATGWRTIKRVKLRVVASTVNTIISGKTFRSNVRRHRAVRLLLPERVVTNCYAAGFSKAIRS